MVDDSRMQLSCSSSPICLDLFCTRMWQKDEAFGRDASAMCHTRRDMRVREKGSTFPQQIIIGQKKIMKTKNEEEEDDDEHDIFAG